MTIEQTLQTKHDNFLLDLKYLANSYGANVLFAVNYAVEKQTAVDYVGEENLIIENGLRYVLTKN